MKRLSCLLLCLVLVLGCMTSCGKKDDGGGETGDKPVVVYCAQLMASLNYYFFSGYPDMIISSNVYETLCWPDDDGVVQPVLAESWDISEDMLTYTFHLTDATFHNGDKLTADDVKFSYEFAKKYPYADRYIKMVESINVIDDKTVEFKLTQPTPMFLPYTYNIKIFNKAFVEASEDQDMKTVECGTGPYTVADFDFSNKCVLQAFPDYRLGEPAIKTVEMRYIADSASAVVALEAGEITVMDCPAAQAQAMIDSGDYNYEMRTPLHTAIIAINCQKAPFDNKLVRQALSYACDKESIIKVAYDGMATKADIQQLDTTWGVDYSKADLITYDPEKAKALLAEAGYPDGLDLTAMGIQFKIIPGGYFERMGQVYQQNLADIGVKVEIVSTETPDEDAMAGDFDIMTEGISASTDFSYSQFMYTESGIGNVNFNQYTDPYVTKTFEDADKLPDEERAEVYKDLVAYIIDACPGIPVMHRQCIYLFDKNLNANMHNHSGSCYHFWEWSWK